MKIKNGNKKYNSPLLTIFSIACIAFFIGIYLGWKNVPGTIKANIVLLINSEFIRAMIEPNTLDNIQISISFKNFEKIKDKRADAVLLGRLISSDNDFVKAKISDGKKNYDCKIRLKGDLPDHWEGEKWSLRVEMKKGLAFNKMSRFSLQDPKTKMDTLEWLFLNSLRHENCMSVRYNFVNLSINGKPMGIYALEEHFSKEMIEANKRREGVVVRFNDDLLWRTCPPYSVSNVDWHSMFRSSSLKVRNLSENLSKDAKETSLNMLRSLQEGELNASSIFAVDELGKFLALTHLWNTEHGLGLDDINFYLNPITSLLEPIGFDGSSGLYPHFCFFTDGDMKDSWVNCVLKDPKIAASYIFYLNRFSKTNYIKKIKSEFSSKELNIRRLLIAELLGKDPASIWSNINKVLNYDPWKNLENKARSIRSELNEKILLHAYAQPIEDNNTIKITIRNTTTQPLELDSFYLGLKGWNCKEHLLSTNSAIMSSHNRHLILPSTKAGMMPKNTNNSFIISSTKLKNSETDWNGLYISAKFLGNPTPFVKIPITVDENLFDIRQLPLHSVSAYDFEVQYPLKFENNQYFIPSGKHRIQRNIYIPEYIDINISAGTSLIFENKSFMVSKGSIQANGTEESPIIFTTTETEAKWPGILITGTTNHSSFKNCKFEKICGIGKKPNPTGITIGSWVMTGGVNLYKANASFVNCTFVDCMTEDALNIFGSRFELINCIFSKTYSDAFDGDFVVGDINDCKFYNIGGDAIDFSGSEANITKCTFFNITDKAISVGEKSYLRASLIKVENANFGVVSKDQSVVTLTDSSIINANVSAISAYQKKPEYGPAKITVFNSSFVDCSKNHLIQQGSFGKNNEKQLLCESFHSELLYNK